MDRINEDLPAFPRQLAGAAVEHALRLHLSIR